MSKHQSKWAQAAGNGQLGSKPRLAEGMPGFRGRQPQLYSGAHLSELANDNKYHIHLGDVVVRWVPLGCSCTFVCQESHSSHFSHILAALAGDVLRSLDQL